MTSHPRRAALRGIVGLLTALAWACAAGASDPPAPELGPADLGVLYRAGDRAGAALAHRYAAERGVPPANVVGLTVPDRPVLTPMEASVLRSNALRLLPSEVKALLLVWSRPYAAGCMSITTALAAGYRPEFCEPGCARTAGSPLFDADTLEVALGLGWRPAMLLPSAEPGLGEALIRRGRDADRGPPRGKVYLVETGDAARNVRAAGFADVERTFGARVPVRRLAGPPLLAPPSDAIAYFTGVARVTELDRLGFVPGAVGDHLTSVGGMLDQGEQTTAVAWLQAGATGSYGTVTEPCNHPGKFPSPIVFLSHYLRGETLLEAYWKSVAMPGQGLFVGEPLARPYHR
jgi:uncharacterized protein (TIGR03790 family)